MSSLATTSYRHDQNSGRQEEQMFHSVHGPCVPAALIFDGTAHLQEAQNNQAPPAYQSLGQSTELQPNEINQTQQTQDSSKKILIQIKFTFYLATEEKSTSSSRKHRVTSSNNDRLEKVNSVPDKIRIYWDPTDNDFNKFKDSVIQEIGKKEDESLAGFVHAQNASGNIDWTVFIPFGGPFAANHKRRLDDSEVFSSFIVAAEGASDERKATCCLVQKDPKAKAQRESAYKRLKQSQSGLGSNEPMPTPTASEASSAEITRLIRDILTAHDPLWCSKRYRPPQGQIPKFNFQLINILKTQEDSLV
ncbi:hypothetical protein PGTUg99_009588 [Puccinia graminis f. sp. tritici]|uniref:Uncharacterized protein n=1 Tax=Puccinia graminis f. sp. tritici TaxID=56615 RepID=A0A5B0RXV9_PUCGR|nr:hypothetical protein PGTUg99_009588 [Puccinia graminis f. sp. tritici]